jgi:hypothetical protein
MKVTEAVPAVSERAGVVTALFAAPGILFVIVTLALVAGPLVGFDPVWRSEPLSLPEAAGLRDDGEVLRLLRAGADIDAAGPIRAGFVKSYEITMTPLEAAVGIRRADMVTLLLDRGARLSATSWTQLVCFARREGAREVEAVLVARRPINTSPPPVCDGIKTPW